MTHGLGPGKPGPRAAKPITPPYVENNYRIEVKITFMLIAYLVLLCEFFWEFSIFHFCRPQVDIYWHPLLSSLQFPHTNNRAKSGRTIKERNISLLYTSKKADRQSLSCSWQLNQLTRKRYEWTTMIHARVEFQELAQCQRSLYLDNKKRSKSLC